MGAEAIKTLLDGLDLDELAADLRNKMIEKGAKSDKRLLRRIEIVENFRASGNKVSWMILDVIPVIPPELRPMVQLDGGRFATSDLNDLYLYAFFNTFVNCRARHDILIFRANLKAQIGCFCAVQSF